MRKKKTAKPLKFHGGKNYLKNIIHALAAACPAQIRTRVYGCAGGWSEGWDWPDHGQQVAEIINDIDGWLINFYEVLAHPTQHKELIRRLRAVPFSQPQWQKSTHYINSRLVKDCLPVDAAAHYFWSMRLSMGGRGDSFAPPTNCRLRNDMLEQASALYGAVEGLSEASVRLRRVMIKCVDVWKLVESLDKSGVWFYIDSPYHPDTRVSKKVYRHEMTAEQHQILLDALGSLKHAKFLLSGYDCKPYATAKRKHGWKSVTVGRPNAASSKKKKDTKQEVFWANYELPKLR